MPGRSLPAAANCSGFPGYVRPFVLVLQSSGNSPDHQVDETISLMLAHALLDCELDQVAFPEVVHAVDSNSALETSTDLAHVFRLALNRADRGVFQDVFPAAPDSRPRIAPRFAIADVAPGNLAVFEDLAHFGHADHLVFVDRFEQTLERFFHVLKQLVDDAIDADFDAVGF